MTQLRLFYIYLFVLLLCAVIGMSKYQKTEKSIRAVIALITLAFITELTGVVLSSFHHYKNPVYHFYSMLELFLTSFYFMLTVNIKNLRAGVIVAGVLSIGLGLFNMQFQDINTFNSYMLIIESIGIISMSLFALYRLMIDDQITNIFRNPHFWIWASFLMYWSGSFFYFSVLHSFVISKSKYYNLISYWQIAINIMFYTIIGIVFLLFPKMRKNER